MHNLQYNLEESPTFVEGPSLVESPSLEMDGVFNITERKEGVVCKLYGCWREEEATAFVLAFKASIRNNYQFSKWSLVQDIAGWEMVSDEAIEILSELIAWSEEHGQVANAYICTGERDFAIFSSMYAQECISKIHYRNFRGIESGIVWLKNLGFNLMSDQSLAQVA